MRIEFLAFWRRTLAERIARRCMATAIYAVACQQGDSGARVECQAHQGWRHRSQVLMICARFLVVTRRTRGAVERANLLARVAPLAWLRREPPKSACHPHADGDA